MHSSFIGLSLLRRVKSSGDDKAPTPQPKARRGRGAKATASRAIASKGWTWESQIPGTLAVLSKVLRLKTRRIWTTTAERDTFIKWVMFLLWFAFVRTRGT